MSPAGTAIFIKPPPTALNHHRKVISFLCKTRFCTLKESATVCTKPIRFKKAMATVSMESTMFITTSDDDKRISPTISSFEQEALIINNGGLHNVLNRMSKWVVAVTFGGFIILRHDDLALWAAMGSVSNFILSITLKRILKQDRPVSKVSSGPGMPSSHAQNIFFTLVFVIMSVIKEMGLNGSTAILGILLIALGSYFSWLRVYLGYHTTNQVIVGTIVGSNFAVLWSWAWEAVVCKACNSNLWVQILLFVGGACYYLGFSCYVLWHLIKATKTNMLSYNQLV